MPTTNKKKTCGRILRRGKRKGMRCGKPKISTRRYCCHCMVVTGEITKVAKRYHVSGAAAAAHNPFGPGMDRLGRAIYPDVSDEVTVVQRPTEVLVIE